MAGTSFESSGAHLEAVFLLAQLHLRENKGLESGLALLEVSLLCVTRAEQRDIHITWKPTGFTNRLLSLLRGGAIGPGSMSMCLHPAAQDPRCAMFHKRASQPALGTKVMRDLQEHGRVILLESSLQASFGMVGTSCKHVPCSPQHL